MSAASLFIVGFLVTLIVTAAMALLIYAAILDGRDAAARRLADRSAPATASGSILEIARQTRQFSTLVAALDRSGLAETLVDAARTPSLPRATRRSRSFPTAPSTPCSPPRKHSPTS